MIFSSKYSLNTRLMEPKLIAQVLLQVGRPEDQGRQPISGNRKQQQNSVYVIALITFNSFC